MTILRQLAAEVNNTDHLTQTALFYIPFAKKIQRIILQASSQLMALPMARCEPCTCDSSGDKCQITKK